MITPEELYDRNRNMQDQHIDYNQRGLDCILSTIKEFGDMMYDQALEDAVDKGLVTNGENSFKSFTTEYCGNIYIESDSILKLKK